MPKILDEAVNSLVSKGRSKDEAFAIATANLKRHGFLKSDGTLTEKGKRKNRKLRKKGEN